MRLLQFEDQDWNRVYTKPEHAVRSRLKVGSYCSWWIVGALRTTVILACSTFAIAPAAGAQREVFEDKDFGGQSISIDGNRSLPRLGALINDRVSSVRVGPQCVMVAFAEEDYRGTTTTFGPGSYAALPEGWDDEISSLHCNCR
jgi:hypothetical protein